MTLKVLFLLLIVNAVPVLVHAGGGTSPTIDQQIIAYLNKFSTFLSDNLIVTSIIAGLIALLLLVGFIKSIK